MDNMESFVLAETLKFVLFFPCLPSPWTLLLAELLLPFYSLHRYHYLLQSPPDLMSLDDYVLNTGG